jgi:signal transduction histidine kinase
MQVGLGWGLAAAIAVLGLDGWRLRRGLVRQIAECWRERRIREELEAYARLDPSVTQALHRGMNPVEATRTLARRVCRTVAEKSAFSRVAMLLRDREGRLVCVGSVGTDDLTLAALHAWGEKLMAEEKTGKAAPGEAELGGVLGSGLGSQLGDRSFSIALGEWSKFDREVGTWALSGKKERRQWRRAVIAPLRLGGGSGANGGRLAGAIVVCADGGRLDGPTSEAWARGGLGRALGPIETLAERLSAEMENEALTERLMKTERLAGLGQLAGGVAHALNNPLTAVIGFAELIAETSGEPRVRQDAGTILLEAKRMQDTVQRLVDFWRPLSVANEAVDVGGILEELAMACTAKLEVRGVKLVLTLGGRGSGEMISRVRGSGDRLRQVFEHLLNNAAQAIATSRPRVEGEEHAIRLTLSLTQNQDGPALHVIVSDTGPGFTDPGKVFDPFYTTRGPEQSAGLGLSICYGIVREHGGEISAFNLHPHGAAVVVELPVRTAVAGESGERVVAREKVKV